MLTKCFGIVSWLPDETTKRNQRIKRLNNLFEQLSDLWSEVPVLIITQNWKNFAPDNLKNKLIRVDFAEGLGIIKARQTLRQEFLKLDYDYIIMLDDDASISYESKADPIKFMQDIDSHPDGFCFIHGDQNEYDSYKPAQLNLCAISRTIYSQEEIPSVDASKDQGYEDTIYACLLHYKYPEKEYITSANITHTQLYAADAPSTWFSWASASVSALAANTNKIKDYIVQNKDLPNISLFNKYKILVDRNLDENNWYVRLLIRKSQQDTSDYYLYF